MAVTVATSATTRAHGRLNLGAISEEGGVRFCVWAPDADAVDVVIYEHGDERAHRLARQRGGYHDGFVERAEPGTRYKFRIGDSVYPDPASYSQPDGVHGASQVVDHQSFAWTDDAWVAPPLDRLVIYELHVGTFTHAGTFDAAAERLDYLADLGVTAIEVMPIASFPGRRNWGYDGVSLYAPAACYGDPEAFKRFVDAAHRRHLAVILDVVYNHFGPEGNYLPALTGGRIFTTRHKTAWGAAVNYDGPDSAPVRDFILQNALYWTQVYHVDGLRIDAAHAIVDDSPKHILAEIAEAVQSLPRPRLIIAEDERNERKVVLDRDEDGYGFDTVWADDLHHQMRRLLAGDDEGYFAAYTGTIHDLVVTLAKGWFYEGQYSEYHGAPRGTPAGDLSPSAFVHCLQNHDQVGNRAFGDRLNHAISPAAYRAASAILLLSPYVPLLWMGQEWAASTPFQYFTDLSSELGALVTTGRREEFKRFSAYADPATRSAIPDPQSIQTFLASRLEWAECTDEPHRGIHSLYRALLQLRHHEPALASTARGDFAVFAADGALALLRRSSSEHWVLVLARLTPGDTDVTTATQLAQIPSDLRWQPILHSDERRFGGDVNLASVTLGRLTLRGPGAVVLRAVPNR